MYGSIHTPGYSYHNYNEDQRRKQQEDADRKWAMSGTAEEQIMKRKHLNDAMASRAAAENQRHSMIADQNNARTMAGMFGGLMGGMGGGNWGQTPGISINGSNGQYLGGTSFKPQSPLANLTSK